MSSLNILDVYGERIINEIDKRINKSIEDYNKIIEIRDKKINDNNKTIEEKINKNKEFFDTINISKNYISLDKKRRIVGVNQSIDKNDVVIKEELDELKSILDNYMKDFDELKKDTITHINNYNEFKSHIATHINNYNEIKNDLDQFKKDTGNNLVNIYTKLNVFPKS